MSAAQSLDEALHEVVMSQPELRRCVELMERLLELGQSPRYIEWRIVRLTQGAELTRNALLFELERMTK